MNKRTFLVSCFALGACYAAAAGGCGGSNSATTSDGGLDGSSSDSGRGPEQTGQECKTASDCYAGLDGATLRGQATCLDQVQNGYCTHVCTKDEDCCAVPGECKTSLKQVCASFESAGAKYCFLSCEASDIQGADAGSTADDFCRRETSSDFSCRSTGGGSQNRKACLPGGAPPGDSGAHAADAGG
jgi:hypothetical protein